MEKNSKIFDTSKIKEIIKDDIKSAFIKRNSTPDLFSNTLDIFSAVIDSKLLRTDLHQWLKFEEARQTQKSIQNIFGELHQKIIGTLKGWEDLGRGNIIDVVNKEKKIIAEIKNKHNTTKGNHKKVIYDDLNECLNNRYKGYTGYCVEILPKNRKIYNVPFTPPDNVTGVSRVLNEKIRLIDGKSFASMTLATTT